MSNTVVLTVPSWLAGVRLVAPFVMAMVCKRYAITDGHRHVAVPNQVAANRTAVPAGADVLNDTIKRVLADADTEDIVVMGGRLGSVIISRWLGPGGPTRHGCGVGCWPTPYVMPRTASLARTASTGRPSGRHPPTPASRSTTSHLRAPNTLSCGEGQQRRPLELFRRRPQQPQENLGQIRLNALAVRPIGWCREAARPARRVGNGWPGQPGRPARRHLHHLRPPRRRPSRPGNSRTRCGSAKWLPRRAATVDPVCEWLDRKLARIERHLHWHT